MGLDDPPYLEALDTYDALGRDPRQYADHGARGVSKAFLAIVERDAAPALRPGGRHGRSPRWDSVYEYLPWEDRRGSTPDQAHPMLEPLRALAGAGGDGRPSRERAESAFGAPWNEERAGERIRLLMEAGALPESARDRWGRVPEEWSSPLEADLGQDMAFDHRLMLADALGRLRGKIKYLPEALRFLVGERFPLSDLYEAVTAVAGRPLDKPNFWRMLTRSRSTRLVESTGEKASGTGRPGPPPTLYRFIPEIHALRLDPSLRFPFSGL